MLARRAPLLLRFAPLLLVAAACAAPTPNRGPTASPGVGGKADETDATATDVPPGLDAPVVEANEYCTYRESAPFVTDIQWDHPKIRAAMRAMGPGYRSTFSYREWTAPYGLEQADSGTEEQKRDARVRNFIRVLLGEHRDFPAMIDAKLDEIIARQVYAGPSEVAAFDLTQDLFAQITYPAYRRMLNVMRAMHSHRQEQRRGEQDGFNYSVGEARDSNRVDHSVAPWTHCEMKFMFSRFMVDGAPAIASWGTEDTPSEVLPATYEAEYEAFKTSECSDEDLAWMYNFRGHKNFQPLWLDSNAFIWNSRRGGHALTNRGESAYYLRPVADRYARGKQAWGAYLFYRDEDAADLQRAGESGGGPILYLTDQDTDENGVADYRLFKDREGCGDQGVSGGSNPGANCNMVEWDLAWNTPNTVGHASSWDPALAGTPDMGFLSAFSTFEARMARFNQALDRHTNWGPTGYYELDASREDAEPHQVRFQGAYSPIVACSYDISASNSFASGDYPSTDPFESGRTKWMYVMRFRTDNYYDERDLADGRPMDFYRDYYNETSLSNDYYRERALDRFGFVPPGDIHANIYFVYGARGEAVPELVDIPAP